MTVTSYLLSIAELVNGFQQIGLQSWAKYKLSHVLAQCGFTTSELEIDY